MSEYGRLPSGRSAGCRRFFSCQCPPQSTGQFDIGIPRLVAGLSFDKQVPVFDARTSLRKPQDVIRHAWQPSRCQRNGSAITDLSAEVFITEDLIQERSYSVNVLVAYLYED